MGGIRQQFGRIAIESRRESFVIHAAYGLRPVQGSRRGLMPGDYFKEFNHPRIFKVTGIDEKTLFVSTEGSTARAAQVSVNASYPRDDQEVILCDSEGNPLDLEVDPESGAFGVGWQERPHPEFLNEDIPDLIQALYELRDNPR